MRNIGINTKFNKLYVVVIVALLAACSEPSSPSTAADTTPSVATSNQAVESNTPAPVTSPAVTSLNPEQVKRRGSILFLQCRACHSLGANEGHLVGPNLHGLFDSIAGKKPDFIYSEPLANSDKPWSDSNLDSFIEMPNNFYPGTKMAFTGISSPEDRTVLIEYLKTHTQ